MSRERENTDQEGDTHSYVHCSTIDNRQDTEATQVSVIRRMRKIGVVCVPTMEHVCLHAKSLQSCPTLLTLQTVAHLAALSVGFSRKEYWSGLPWPPPVHLPDPGIEPSPLMSPALAGRVFTTGTTWEAHRGIYSAIKKNELLPRATTGTDLVK